MYNNNVICRKIHAAIGAGNSWVVPLSDMAHKNSRQRLGSEVQFSANARNVVRQHISAKYGGKMQDLETVLVFKTLQLLVIHWAIGRAEINGAFGDLLDPAAGSNGLVINLY